jgi:serine/threonine protein kinase/Tfp pilus assembly protein PilF
MTCGQESLFGGLEEIVESFEDACAQGKDIRLQDFLPPLEDPGYLRVLQELIRVHLDLGFRRGRIGSLEDYRGEFPELFESPDLLAPLAFEEYRLRLNSASPLHSSIFSERYGIDTSQWPSAGSSHASTRDALNSGVNVTLTPGEQLLDFVIVGELGSGAFSRVYLARQSSLSGRLVVLKISSIRLKEAERLARLQHTNIVPVYSVHDWGRYSILCMPWFGATTLKDVIQSVNGAEGSRSGESVLSTVLACDSKTLTSLAVSPQAGVAEEPAESTARGVVRTLSRSPLASLNLEQAILWIGQRIAEGLAHAHARGILHRDLKPANVLLTEDGQPMILDFNLATEKQFDDPADVIAGGTLPYMSPEQIASIECSKPLDAQADVYSLGVMLFEMLTGQLPFRQNGGDRRQMIEERRNRAPGPRELTRTVSIGVDSIIRKCLAPGTEDRYHTASELVTDLSRQLGHQPLKHAANRSWKELATKWMRRHPQIASSSGILTLSAIPVALMAVLWWQGQSRLLAANARQVLMEFREKIPNLHAEAFAAAIGDSPAPAAAQMLENALLPFRDEDGQSSNQNKTLSVLSSLERQTARQEIAQLEFLLQQLKAEQTTTSVDNSSVDQSTSHSVKRSESRSMKSIDDIIGNDARNYLDALELVFQHRFTEAQQKLTPMTIQHPERFPVILLQGMLERSHGRLDDAEALLTSALALQPLNTHAWYQRGACRVSRLRYEGAIADFSRVLELDPDNNAARVSRAIANQYFGHPDLSLADLDIAIHNGFPETRVYFIRASVHRMLQNPEASQKDIEHGLRLVPTDERSWIARGLAQLPNHPELAMSDFREAKRLNPTSHDAYRNMSMVLSEYLKKPDESIAVLTEAMPHHPQDAYLWSGRGVLHARAGRRDAAVQDAEKAMSLSSEPMISYMAACIFALTTQYHEADRNRGFQLLKICTRDDASLVSLAKTDPDLSPLSSRPEFHTILSAAALLSSP